MRKTELPKDTWQKSQCFGVLLCFDVPEDIYETLLPQTMLPAQALSQSQDVSLTTTCHKLSDTYRAV